jgi:hypothetical protein
MGVGVHDVPLSVADGTAVGAGLGFLPAECREGNGAIHVRDGPLPVAGQGGG